MSEVGSGWLVFQPPASFDFAAPDQWPAWQQRFSRFRVATKLSEDDGEVQVATLLYSMGPSADSIFENQLGLSADDKKDFAKVIEAFDKYFKPTVNVVHERTKFERVVQRPGQTVEEFLRALHDAAVTCDFKDARDDRIRDRFVAHLRDRTVSQAIQMKDASEQTLAKAIAYARQAEHVAAQVATQAPSAKVHAATASTDRLQAQVPGKDSWSRTAPASTVR